MERIYKCPICGKSYNSLTEMYNCAVECEKQEGESEKKLVELRNRIKMADDVLKDYIKEYNSVAKDSSYEHTLVFTSSKEPALNYVSGKKEDSFAKKVNDFVNKAEKERRENKKTFDDFDFLKILL